MPIIEGRHIVLPREDGQYDIAVIQKVDHVATVGNKDEAERLIRLINMVGTAAADARKAAPPAIQPAAAKNGRKKAASRKVSTAKKKTVGGRKKTTKRRATRKVSTGRTTPAKKEAVDVSHLASIVESATK